MSFLLKTIGFVSNESTIVAGLCGAMYSSDKFIVLGGSDVTFDIECHGNPLFQKVIHH